MPSTYEPIATTTLGSSSSTIDFTSIPTTYTDLVVVLYSKSANSINNDGINMTVGNGTLDTGSNYSATILYNSGGGIYSFRFSNSTSCEIGLIHSQWSTGTFYLQNYSNTSTYKSFLGQTGSSAGTTDIRRTVGLWRSTAAINTIRLQHGGQQFITGTKCTIFGIKAA